MNLTLCQQAIPAPKELYSESTLVLIMPVTVMKLSAGLRRVLTFIVLVACSIYRVAARWF